ncbi:MAG: hypothetical protein WAM82_13710 [Thermoanaerobaculia bacterium]
MAFQTRELMINIGGWGGQWQLTTIWNRQACQFPTVDPGCFLSPFPPIPPYCGPVTYGPFTCGNTCGITPPPPQCHNRFSIIYTPVLWEETAGVRLTALKEQLRTALAEVEAQEKAEEEASRPRFREEAEELEEKLKGALEEVRGLKKTLPSGGSK